MPITNPPVASGGGGMTNPMSSGGDLIYGSAGTAPGANLALAPVGGGAVTPTVSATYDNAWLPGEGKDGLFGDNGWAANNNGTGHWYQLTWAVAQAMSRLTLYTHTIGGFGSGTTGISMTFSDGSTELFPGIPANASQVMNFPRKTGITWVRVTTTAGSPGTLASIRELEVYDLGPIGQPLRLGAGSVGQIVTILPSGLPGYQYPGQSILDIPMATTGNNEEMAGPLSSWTVEAGSGAITNQSLGSWYDTAPSAPSYNINSDVKGALVMQPIAGSTMRCYRTFAPGSGTKWALVAKVFILKGSGSDDVVNLHVMTNTTLSAAGRTDSPYDGITINYGNIGGVHGIRALRTSGGTAGGLSATAPTNLAVPTWLAIVGLATNQIDCLYSTDGIAWSPLASYTGLPVNGAVAYAGVSVLDYHSATIPVIGVVDYVRFLTGSNNLWALGMGK